MDCGLPGSSHGIFQARVLQWVAISFSRGSSPPGDWTQVPHTVGRRFTVWATREVLSIVYIQYYLSYRYIISKRYTSFMKWSEVKVSCVWLFAIAMNYTVHGILQARILEWVALPFSSGSSQPRDWTKISHIEGRFCTSWHTREAPSIYNYCKNWLYFFCYTMYILQVYFICNSLFLLIPSFYTASPTSLFLLVTTSLFSVSLRLFLIWLYILVCCIFILVPYNICLSLNYFT